MKNRYDLEVPDLTPDLEWMLSSGQVSSALLLERLLQDYYPKIFQLAFSILDDRILAGRVARDIFVKAMLDVHRYTSAIGADIWLYRIAWKLCQKSCDRQKARLFLEKIFLPVGKTNTSEPSSLESPLDAQVWQAIAALDEFSKWALILHTLHGWPVEMIGQVAGASTLDVQAALDSARQEIGKCCLKAGQAETDLPAGADMPAALLRLFSMRWPAPSPGEFVLEELADDIDGRVAGKQSRVKPYATFLEVSLLAIVVLVAGGFLAWAGRGSQASSASPGVSLQATPSQEGVVKPSSTPESGYRYRSTDGSRLMPRGYDLIPVPTSTPTPDGVLYDSQDGEPLVLIALRLDVPLDELRQFNRLSENVKFAQGQLLYIPGSLPRLTPRRATAVPQPMHALPLDAPASSEDIAGLLFPEYPTYHTVWFDAILSMHPQRPFSDQPERLHIQLWLSEDQALLLGGPVGEEPYDVLLWINGNNYVASPVEANPWFRPAGDLPGESLIDPRLMYGAILFLKETFSYGYPKYQYIGEEMIAGRPSWTITVLDEQMASGAVFNIDKQTGFILKYLRNQDDPNPRRTRAYMPREALITAIDFNVDFPQELFNPRFPWRGGYALDHSGEPVPFPVSR